jgi:hypothetical protein
MEAEDPAMRERLVGLKLHRDQIAKEIGQLQNQMASSTPTITPEKVARVGGLLRDKLYQGAPEFRQAYARLLMDEVRITEEEICISGSKSVLARCAAEGVAEPVPKVLSFVQEWRAQRESNPCFRRERATSWTARRWARAWSESGSAGSTRCYKVGASRWQGRWAASVKSAFNDQRKQCARYASINPAVRKSCASRRPNWRRRARARSG